MPYWCILFIDVLILYATALGIYFVFQGRMSFVEHFVPLTYTSALYILVDCFWFRVFRTYSGILRFSSFVDLRRIAYAMACGLLTIVIGKAVLHTEAFLLLLRYRELFSIALFSTFGMWVVRIIVKAFYDVAMRTPQTKLTFIYGVTGGSIGLAKQIRNEKPARFKLAGFVTEDNHMKKHMLMGVQVYMDSHELIEEMKNKKANCFLVPPELNDTFRRNENLQNHLIENNFHIYMMQPAAEVDEKGGKILPSQLKEVDVEDLLPREQIEVDLNAVGNELTGKNILVTGAAGSIGSEIVRQVASFKPAKLMLIDQAETPLHDIRLMMAKNWPELKADTIVASICNEEHMEKIFQSFQPGYVFHAAAYKHVPMMEDNPREAVFNNIHGTKLIADLSVKYHAKKFVMISTDKAVNPTNVMGCSKRICEIYVQSLDAAEKAGRIPGETQFVTTRFGNVLGSNGSVIPLFKQQIKNGGPVTVTDRNIIRFFMLIPEACKLVLEAGTRGNGGEIFVFDMGQPVKIADLAKRMILLCGAKDIEIKYTGLRDGEKLYEEVLNDKEITLPTFNKKIKIAQVRQYDYQKVCQDILDLIEKSKDLDDMGTVKIMKTIVPEYISQHSKYEVLDKA